MLLSTASSQQAIWDAHIYETRLSYGAWVKNIIIIVVIIVVATRIILFVWC